ncbi:hypothetical protein NDU88_010371 [Pleurodeles waltl]|uniref:Uncharacterized protein n=1 Tax=Pleurodeles waltl TaxID=8319 RepID=A0AAV7S122_PLEWA|nr:hypothetical protein NDU88_010371 [Pleurodeles waltl]
MGSHNFTYFLLLDPPRYLSQEEHLKSVQVARPWGQYVKKSENVKQKDQRIWAQGSRKQDQPSRIRPRTGADGPALNPIFIRSHDLTSSAVVQRSSFCVPPGARNNGMQLSAMWAAGECSAWPPGLVTSAPYSGNAEFLLCTFGHKK